MSIYRIYLIFVSDFNEFPFSGMYIKKMNDILYLLFDNILH